jgi:riboflavin kinase/FMN adenylyltransferase
LRVVRGSDALGAPSPSTVLTFGNFDGLHVGHRTIIEIVVRRARELGGVAMVYTFDPHPRRVLQPEKALGLLTTLEQRLELFEAFGADVVVVETFDRAFAETSPESFVRRVLHERIRPVELHVGHDAHFGHDRAGSMRLLEELAPRLGMALFIVPQVTLRGSPVSSTRIRALLAAGEVAQAAEALGRPYTVRGRVVPGERRGRTLGFPTANLDPENEVLPAAGVYAGHLRRLGPDAGSGGLLPAVTNVGRRPTFAASDPVLAETHCIDVEADLYGQRVEVSFRFHLREERRFPDAEALRAQIGEDVDRARRLLGGSREAS